MVTRRHTGCTQTDGDTQTYGGQTYLRETHRQTEDTQTHIQKGDTQIGVIQTDDGHWATITTGREIVEGLWIII
jgi:hypothetical protein